MFDGFHLDGVLKDPLYILSYHFSIPLAFSALYALAVYWHNQSLNTGRRQYNRPLVSPRYIQAWCVAHNGLLCIYSAWVSCTVSIPMIRNFWNYPLLSALRDDHHHLRDAGGDFWIWTFYLSKYYEVLDSAILWAKGRPVPFLQLFHHTGVIWNLWLMGVAHTQGAWIYPAFNGFVHIFVYFYYAATSLGIQISFKKYITLLEILHFLLGGVMLNIAYLMNREHLIYHPIDEINILAWLLDLDSIQSYMIAQYFTFIYVLALITLFFLFYHEKYRRGSLEA